jgi:hypothetical protein
VFSISETITFNLKHPAAIEAKGIVFDEKLASNGKCPTLSIFLKITAV